MKKINGEKMYQAKDLYRRLGRRYSTMDSWCVAVGKYLREAGVVPVVVGRGRYYREDDVRRVMKDVKDRTPFRKAAAMAKAREVRSEKRAAAKATPSSPTPTPPPATPSTPATTPPILAGVMAALADLKVGQEEHDALVAEVNLKVGALVRAFVDAGFNVEGFQPVTAPPLKPVA